VKEGGERTTVKRAGIILTFIGLAVGTGVYAAFGGVDGDDPRAFLAMPVYAIAVIGMLLYYRGRQIEAKTIASGPGNPLHDPGQHILYLRAFRTDPSGFSKVVRASLATEEEQLGVVLRPFGALIAVGRPGERLPVPGAARMYATDAEWQRLVHDQMRVARLVVIRAGGGAGLLWEIEQAFHTVAPERLLILVLSLPLNEYETFARQIRERCRVILPTIGKAGLSGFMGSTRQRLGAASPGFVTFDASWTPTFLPLPFALGQTGFNDLRKPFNVALRPVFERSGVSWRDVGRLSS
jgi:hypothetical protein